MDKIESNDEWTSSEVKDLAKYCASGETISYVMRKLRRTKGDVEKQIKHCGFIINNKPQPKETIIVTPPPNRASPPADPSYSILPNYRDNIVDEISLIKAECKQLIAMNKQLEKEIKENEEKHQKKIQEIVDYKTKLDPKKDFVRCPSCKALWEIQKVIED